MPDPPANRDYASQPKFRARVMNLMAQFETKADAWKILGAHGVDSESLWDLKEPMAEVIAADLAKALKEKPAQEKFSL